MRRGHGHLDPDPSRVVARLFLPGEELAQPRSRASAIVARLLALPEDDVQRMAVRLRRDFSSRHRDYPRLLATNAGIISSRLDDAPTLTDARAAVLGATFTAEFAVEGAALCNPSAVLHPDQTSLGAGQVRVALSLRGIGEGHLSSIGFCSAVAGPGATWSFETRAVPVVAGITGGSHWRRAHFRAVLAEGGSIDEVASTVLRALPTTFEAADLERAVAQVHPNLVSRGGGHATVDLLRQLASSAYEVTFPSDVELAQQVLLPTAAEESHGMEDARFVRFVDDDGSTDYRATYTAYDGRNIAPRLLTSPDLRVFRAHRLAGPAAHNKGMALFPRQVAGRHLALCRTDGETTGVASSKDGYLWGEPRLVQAPSTWWELLQVGNCGPPIETGRGWLVLTHGVGPMRTYSIGAILLDLDDPSRLVARLAEPLLAPTDSERDGYVPNVLYSCGAIVHQGTLWLPYGVGDARVAVASVRLEELLDRMSPCR